MWWITAGYLLIKGRWSHLNHTLALTDVWQASETSHSKSSLCNVQHQYLHELLFNVYSYCVILKIVPCRLCGRWLISNLVIYNSLLVLMLQLIYAPMYNVFVRAWRYQNLFISISNKQFIMIYWYIVLTIVVLCTGWFAQISKNVVTLT